MGRGLWDLFKNVQNTPVQKHPRGSALPTLLSAHEPVQPDSAARAVDCGGRVCRGAYSIPRQVRKKEELLFLVPQPWRTMERPYGILIAGISPLNLLIN